MRTAKTPEQFEKFFWMNVDKDGPIPVNATHLGPCWIWKMSKSKAGYGFVYKNRKVTYAHRIARELLIGPIPEKKHVLHHCDNPPCCNPNHTFLGDQRSNNADKIAKGRQAKGNQFPQAKLTPEKVIYAKQQRAAGRTCASIGLELHVHHMAISRATRGIDWAHVH